MFSWLRLRHLRRKAAKLDRQEQQRRVYRNGDASVIITASGPGTVIAANTINGNLTITNGEIHIDSEQDDHEP
jgi:ABC-type uncharacterized transport system ATPase component